MHKIVLVNCSIYFNNEIAKHNIYFENNEITEISNKLNIDGWKVIEASHLLITPNFLDLHVHTRNPGFERKEEIKTFVDSALKGGWTRVIAMGNISPCPDNVDSLSAIQNSFQKWPVEIIQTANVTKGLQGKELTNFDELSKLTNFFTDDGAGIQKEQIMIEALKAAKKNNVTLLVHEEDHNYRNKGYAYKNPYAIKNNIDFFPTEYEWKMIERDVLLQKNILAKLHIQHITTKEGIEIFKKHQNKNLTGEITFNHLILDSEFIKENNANFKINPPLPLISDKPYLIKAVKDKVIPFIVTDHAPHQTEEKEKGLQLAPYGMIGSEIAFPCMYTFLVEKNLIDLQTIIEAISINPAKHFFAENWNIQLNKKISLNIIDLSYEKELTIEDIVSKGKNTPFLGSKIKSKIVQVWRNGIEIYNDKSLNIN